MNWKALAFSAHAAACATAFAAGELTVTADRMAADNRTRAFVASGHVNAVSHPFRILADELSRDAEGRYAISSPATVTTCTNDAGHLHWHLTGSAEYMNARYVRFRSVKGHLWGVPVAWLPYWYQPLDTDYGLRVMPGYTGRWGAYLLTKYAYHIAGDASGDEGRPALKGATRFDLRYRNGVALGQSLRWRLGDFGEGWFKAYYAWDEDHDRYSRHWNDQSKWNYRNWGSEVPRDRYAVELAHRWEPTERDIVRGRGVVYSDSYFRGDFLRNSLFGNRNPFHGHEGNELAWERNEGLYGVGVSASGPLNDFYGGTERLPEVYIDVTPQPFFGMPANYESQTRAGYLNRRAARYGDLTKVTPFSRNPGDWADYNTFRFDTYHRLTAPFKVRDVVAVVPRVGVRGTWWGESGRTLTTGAGRAGASGKSISRVIAEGGVTFSARGAAWLNDKWQHMVEPYADVLAQEAWYSGDGGGRRPYVFDGVDGSSEWLDQFAGRSRGLPYSWYGVTPGLRNSLRRADEKGVLRTVLDVDAYAAVQLNKGEWTSGGRYHRLAKPGEPNYGRHSPTLAPGARARWTPADGMSLSARGEYDAQDRKLAYAAARWSHRVTRSFTYHASYICRDHRWWDYSSSPYDRRTMRSEDFNWAHFGVAELGFEHELCDAVAWGPFIRWDCREDELDEVGGWVDYRTDCLGFRFLMSYENDFVRIDGSEYDHDWRFGFYVYLRAFGPDWGGFLGD